MDIKNHNSDMSSDSDDEPEEIQKETSKSVALKQIEDERAAAKFLSMKTKEKRRLEIERNTEQKKERTKLKLNSIPYDLLAKVATAKFTESPEEKTESKIEIDLEDNNNKLKPLIPLNKKIKFTDKTLTTPSTKFQVIKLDELSNFEMKGRKVKNSCFDFRFQKQYMNRNVKRVYTSAIKRDILKRNASK